MMTPVSPLKRRDICASFTDEQMKKIQHRKRYLKKQKAETSTKDDELDLLGEGDGDSFTGSNADLESAADNLFTSPPRPQPLPFSSLSLKTPAKSVPPTPGTALQHKIETNLEKSLGNSLNIHLQQQMGSFQASMLEAFQSLREELTTKKQTEVDQTSFLASKPGTSSKTAVILDLPPPRTSTNIQTEAMDVDYSPALPPRLVLDQHDTSDQYVATSELPPKKVSDQPKKHSHSRSRLDIESRSASDQSNVESDESRIPSTKPKKHSDKSKHKSRSRYVSSSSGEDQSPVVRYRSSKPSGAQPSGAVSDQDLPQHDPDPPYYKEVALSDIPSQYAEEVDTFRRILSLPDPRESMPRSSTSVMGLDDEKSRQELRPRGPSCILPLSSVIKDAFDKFQHDFKAANLPEGKYVKPPPSTSKWYRVGQPCYQDKYQELNTDFAKICITPKPSGAPMGKVPLPILKELEHQARQNISTLNFTAAFAKTSSCNASLEKCQHSIKSTVKKIKSQIQKGANPEKAAKRGYEEVCEYMDFWKKTVLIQHRALTCLSKSLAHILQRELYSMANTGLLRREAEMTLLQPHLGETRRQELRNSSFWDPSLFESQLVKEGEDFLLKKGTSKDSQGFAPYQNKPFCGPHNKRRGSYRKRPYGGNSSQSSNQSFSSARGKPNFRGSRGRFRPHNRGRGRGNPSSQ